MSTIKLFFAAAITIAVCCSNNSITDVASIEKSVSVCYEPHNETEYKVDWYEATLFIDGDYVGTVYPDSECIKIEANLSDTVIADFGCDVLVNDKVIKTKYHQVFIIYNIDTTILIP